MSVDFTTLLGGQTLGEIEKPKALPIGTYECLIKSTEYGESNQKKTPFVRFHLEVIQPMDDVDEAELEEFGNPAGKKIRHDIYLTENTMHQMQDFILYHVGLELEGKSLAEAIPECVNQVVAATIKHEYSQDGEETYARVAKTLNPAE